MDRSGGKGDYMKIGKYEKVTLRSEKRVNQLKAVLERIDSITSNGDWSAILTRHFPLTNKIATVIMEHRIYNRGIFAANK